MARPGGIFSGVRFVLIGFDSVSEGQYRLELTQKGGVDLGKSRCTHVIVSGLVYDDPVCSLARNEGKFVVNETWIDDSLDLGILADPKRVLYRPLKDPNGIPGTDSLHICLTGYQRQEREDIMRMVNLMGAQFSKPLVANKVTHLICYKFEGEKYELAKRVNIKLVNHRWLEDCLKYWTIQPVENYAKSGYELELMETEARDSDEETDDEVAPIQNDTALNARTGPTTSSLKSPAPIQSNDNPSTSGSKYQKSPSINPGQTPNRRSENSNLSSKSPAPSSFKEIPSKGPKNSQKINLTGGLQSEKTPSLPVKSPLISSDQTSNKTIRSSQNSGSHIKSLAPSPLNDYISDKTSHLPIKKFPILSSSRTANTPKSPKDIGSERTINLPVKSPLLHSNSNTTPSPHSDKGSENIPKLPVKKFPILSSSRTENTPKPPKDIGSERTINLPVKSPLFNSNSNATPSPHSDKGFENKHKLPVKSPLITPEIVKSSDNINQNSAKAPFHEIGSGSTNITQSGTKGNLVNSPQNVEILQVTRQATPNLSENKEVELSITPQSEFVSRKTLSLSSKSKSKSKLKSPLGNTPVSMPISNSDQNVTKNENITPQCKELKSMAEPGSCEPVLGTSNAGAAASSISSKRSYSRKPRTKSISPVEQPSSHSVIEIAEKDRTGEASEKAETEKGSSSVLSQKRKAVDESNSTNPFVTNDFKELEQINYISKGDNDNTVDTDMGTSTNKPVRKTMNKKRNSLKCAKPPKHSPSNLNKNNSDEKIEEGNAAGPIVLDDSSGLVSPVNGENNASSSKDKAPEIVTFVPENTGGTDTRDPLKESKKKSLTKKKMLEIKGLLPDNTIETNSKNLSSNVNNENKNITTTNNNFKLPPGARIKKAVAKRSFKSTQQQNPGSNSFNRNIDNNNTGIITNEENINTGMNLGTDKKTPKDNGEVSEPRSSKSNITMDWLLTSLELDPEKENKNKNKNQLDDSSSKKENAKSCNKNRQLVKPKKNENGGIVTGMDLSKCFILSGHRYQRKEFQSMVKKLRGRVCRDSHNWSFQATHFIVPGPVRRTEKFFAAAAAGRWILKMEYLTASYEAGRFVEEEEYEWYGTGLTEDNSINLEAPRKWRLLRERTGHGAFYGLNFFIYGDCIAPKLDTLKRVIKAGDGTVLATCPPYTRFMKKNHVDFCVVPMTTSSDDPWVQEFLSRKIPCVTSDFLVEFICKPGSSLSKHILFRTEDFVNKSLEKLEKFSQEFVKEIGYEFKEENLKCEFCGKSDRDEFMLICGDDSGRIGCGLGMHIDCCEPKLERVPEDDWFCDKCRVVIGRKTGKKRCVKNGR